MCLSADGGKWIGRLGALMPNAVFVMDGGSILNIGVERKKVEHKSSK